MRTAEEIQLNYVGLCDNSDLVKLAIKMGMQEAIIECADKAESESYYEPLPADLRQSILNLINQIK